MNIPNTLESYEAEINKFLVKQSFFHETMDEDDIETRKFSCDKVN